MAVWRPFFCSTKRGRGKERTRERERERESGGGGVGFNTDVNMAVVMTSLTEINRKI